MLFLTEAKCLLGIILNAECLDSADQGVGKLGPMVFKPSCGRLALLSAGKDVGDHDRIC
jgi:hypothetical protein